MKTKTYYINLIRNALKKGKALPQTSLVYFQGTHNGCWCFWEMYVDLKNNEVRLAYKYNNLVDSKSSIVSGIFPLNLPEEELLKDIIFYTTPGGWCYSPTDIK